MYALAVASVALAAYASFVFERHGFHTMAFPVFLLAVASTFWYRGVGPTIVAAVLAALTFDYCFTEPRYTFLIVADDLPWFAAFLLMAGMVVQRKNREEKIRRLNEQLTRRTAELEAVNAELEAFVYSISHDLRAPLRHMSGFTELLQNSAGSAFDEKSRRYKLGVNAYVVKPVDFHEFVNAVKELGCFWALINEPPPGSVPRK